MIKEHIILGIDPGTTIMGYGILKVSGNKTEMLAMGVLDLKKYSNHYLKLQRVFARTLSLIDEFHPDHLAIEAPFFGKNVQSMLKLGRAQGVAMSAALYRDVPITEYAPLKIKMAITGSGSASKEQVADMLRRYLKIPQESMLPQLDATDGLAAAYCHFLQLGKPTSEKAYSGWKDFIAKNEGKVKTPKKIIPDPTPEL
ncbi:crossover junction endodeoxyribonuclease RuvC [Paludibacter propionicigenes WB4]|uniref:Crossover junction endodeoxyribonuclease RuvC n=1 Tax=Paludibacter propionicigenes (strain DSM 17365 / JCM 13257 / WB4) TaxID=694427 RepID=E4T3V2_PALPW|nr:crossover junction endodeoxyribonuclease RuvC [Paludibacter propionicigenes]ADQ79396.1 crossover junction endodeoxyribonuclease RuvC [Paludibacter propionicigenes WB4]